MACAAAAAFVGCSTYDNRYDNRDAQGRPQTEYGTYGPYYGSSSPASREPGIIEGLNRGVNTNYFGPVNSGPEAALGPGTISGGGYHVRP